MADVFLSYARASAREARRIAEKLRSLGLSVWFDEKLPAHRAYSDVIEEQLETARAVLVMWSQEAVRSQWVRSEANRARETGRLVQIRLDDVRLPMPFDQIQCADLRGRRGQDSPPWDIVVSSISALVDKDISPAPATAPVITRRGVIIGGAAAALAVTGVAGWQFWRKPRISPQAQLFLQKGMDELQTNDAFELNDPASLDQAIALLGDATRLAPDSALAWGALALAYAARKKASPLSERSGLDARSRSAASRALELDSREARAIGALRMLEPVYRNWLTAERADRDALKLQPRMPLLLFLLADMLGSVGRWKDAAAVSRKFDRKNFLIAGADRKVIVSLWSAGDLPGADDAIREAVQHWPHNPYIWRTRLAYLTYTGRTSDALELLRSTTDRPADISDDLLDSMDATIQALAPGGSAATAVGKNLDYLRKNPSAAMIVAHACAALGAVDAALAILAGYYFGQGDWSGLAPPGGDQDRVTATLFMPPMRPLWSDPRFDTLLTRIGLAEYWRRSGTLPDYRRR